MAPSELATFNASVSTTEISLMTGSAYSSASPQTSDYTIQVFISFENLVAGDVYRIRIYEKVIAGGTQLPMHELFVSGGQSKGEPFPALMVMHGWDVTALKISGGDRTLIGSIRGV